MLVSSAESVAPLLTMSWALEDGAPSLQVSGELDIATAPQLEEILAEVIRPGAVVTLDVAELGFIDAAGLRVLASAARDVGTSGGVFLRHPAARVQRFFALVALHAVANYQADPVPRAMCQTS